MSHRHGVISDCSSAAWSTLPAPFLLPYWLPILLGTWCMGAITCYVLYQRRHWQRWVSLLATLIAGALYGGALVFSLIVAMPNGYLATRLLLEFNQCAHGTSDGWTRIGCFFVVYLPILAFTAWFTTSGYREVKRRLPPQEEVVVIDNTPVVNSPSRTYTSLPSVPLVPLVPLSSV